MPILVDVVDHILNECINVSTISKIIEELNLY